MFVIYINSPLTQLIACSTCSMETSAPCNSIWPSNSITTFFYDYVAQFLGNGSVRGTLWNASRYSQIMVTNMSLKEPSKSISLANHTNGVFFIN